MIVQCFNKWRQWRQWRQWWQRAYR